MGGWQLLTPAMIILMTIKIQASLPTRDSTKTTNTSGEVEMCPSGMFLSPRWCQAIGGGCHCEACPQGFYQKAPSLEDRCQRCSSCLGMYGHVQVKPCTATQDAQCGCKAAHYKELSPNSDLNDFICKRCRNCSQLHKVTRRDCSEAADTECGDCLSGFCNFGSLCRPCPGTTTLWPLSTRGRLAGIQPTGVETCGTTCKSVLGCSALLLLLLGGLTVYHKRSQHGGLQPLSGVESQPRVYAGQRMSDPPLPETGLMACGGPPPRALLQQGRKLYAIIDAVPVRRWKEFVRGLGLRDGEIELVELEHSQFREQQYEMLKRWSQRRGACVETILALLEEMQLGGCAQELREHLAPRDPPHHIP